MKTNTIITVAAALCAMSAMVVQEVSLFFFVHAGLYGTKLLANAAGAL